MINKTQLENVIVFNYVGPKIIDQKIVNGKLELLLDNKVMTYKVIISKKTLNKYIYRDVGLFKREFDDLDYMLWEFELPRDLKSIIKNLPLTK
jgi:hypothetical protein